MSNADGDAVHDGMIRAQSRGSGAAAAGRERVLPPAVQARYLRDADRLLFPDRAPAIEDRGERLLALTGNAQVAADLVAIAQARGWTRISSHGTDPFRADIRRAAVRFGIEVVNDPQARAGAGRSPPPQEAPTIEIPHGAPAGSVASTGLAARSPLPPSRPAREPRPPSAPTRRPGDTLTGRLVESGEAPYRFDPKNSRSFYVRLQTASGIRDIWGTELRRALAESATRPQPGDSIAIRFLGTDQTLSKRPGPDGTGGPARPRNLWQIETAEVLEARRADAASIRSSSGPVLDGSDRAAVLRDASAILRAAEVFASSRITVTADRGRFVEAVRQTLAATVERGQRIPEVRVRKAPHQITGQTRADTQRELPLGR